MALAQAVFLAQLDNDDQAIGLWLHGKAAHSGRAYAADIARFRAAVLKPLPLVTLADLQGFADGLAGLAPASRKRTLAAVKSLLAFAHRLGYCQFDVGAALRLRRPKNTLAERILPREAMLRILALETAARNHALLAFLYQTGARASEVCGLTWRDIQARDAGGQATLYGKGDKTRAVLFSPSLAGELAALRGQAGPDAPVFASRSGKHLDQPAVFRIVRASARRAGVTAAVSPHWLRHAAASHALDGGAPVHLVQQQLGHASLETTTRYAHARPGDGLFRYLG